MESMDSGRGIEQLILQHSLGHLAAKPQPLQGDGSDRRFYRLTLRPARTIIAVLPSLATGTFSREAASSVTINRHLASKGVPVPRLLAFAPGSGVMLYEDAGDTHLAELVLACQGDAVRIEALYRPVIDTLLHMQVRGVEGFAPSMCWEAPRYDRQTMLEREAMYFLNSFCLGYCGQEIGSNVLLGEIERIISKIELIVDKQGEFFLHRDFQSRNIMMLADGSFRIIDYQAGRFGPLAYDLASLLIDPYVSLSPILQQRLFDYYCQQLESRFNLDSGLLRASYGRLACMRNMQILGAFSFLLLQKKKTFFKKYIPGALAALNLRLQEKWAADLPTLRSLVKTLHAEHPFFGAKD